MLLVARIIRILLIQILLIMVRVSSSYRPRRLSSEHLFLTHGVVVCNNKELLN